MIENFIAHINWVDIVLIVIIGRGMFVGFKSSFVVELLKFLGTLVSIFVTLHYFLSLGKFLHENLGFEISFAVLLAFILLWIAVTLVFSLVRMGIFLVLKMNAGSGIDGYLGLMVATVSSIFICSMVLMLLYVSRGNYVGKQARHSLVGQYVQGWAPGFYKFTFKNICEKFFPEEKINQKVFSLMSDKDSKANQEEAEQ